MVLCQLLVSRKLFIALEGKFPPIFLFLIRSRLEIHPKYFLTATSLRIYSTVSKIHLPVFFAVMSVSLKCQPGDFSTVFVSTPKNVKIALPRRTTAAREHTRPTFLVIPSDS